MANMMSPDDKDNDVMGSCGRKNKHGRRSFSRYVKALFFETSLMKKMRSKKLGQKLNRNYTNLKYSKPISKSTNDSPSMNEDNHSKRSTSSSAFSPCLCTTSTMNSTSTTATTSRCSSSSVSSNSRLSLSETMENNKQGKVGNGNGFNVGICLFLISLLVLVIWGKVCAIFCTSTWLFFACRWSKFKPVPSENITVDHHFPEIDTELHKKKVIMEGLLERNHTQKSKSFPLLKL
ncbi:uncharacterized protein LOC111276488 [Durio zibethinus]|uniref:Uncharacterized protein LOC111276488 n=1 Tax=Durio zibethinus TaxID=66656 RepID=A0A6P5WR24_DURZI|nr:uncharacterized protein LOC111276488 [Durio zibethinus]